MSLLSKVTTEGRSQPPRMVLYAGEKFGKSSFGAHAWKPIFLMTAAETGLLSLLEANRVPETAHFPDDFKSWSTLTQAVTAIRDDKHEYRTLVIDTGNGAEQLCAAETCEEEFGGRWSDYASYGRGDVLTSKKWAAFLRLLDEVRARRRMAVLILQHAKVKTFQDPAGKDWDQWRPEAIDKCWALTHKWADVIAFGGFKVSVDKQEKATSERRFLRLEASAAIVAGNRYGLPASIEAPPGGAAGMWKAFADALTKVKSGAKAPAAVEAPKVEVPREASREPGDEGDYIPSVDDPTADPANWRKAQNGVPVH